MNLPLYQVDAFTDRVFGGNPAAVVPLESWPSDELLQAIARENNLSETAFYVKAEDDAVDFHLRWFTPAAEVPLCGHATLATAWVLFHRLGWEADRIRFQSRSGLLTVGRGENDSLVMDFPNLTFDRVETPSILKRAIPDAPEQACFVPNDTNYLLELPDEEAVRRVSPDLSLLRQLGNQGVIVTAPGERVDFVSRYFAPGVDVDEDPVTGSIHSVLTPYWAEKLGRSDLEAEQLSERGGWLGCELRGDRVRITGHCAFYMAGTIEADI